MSSKGAQKILIVVPMRNSSKMLDTVIQQISESDIKDCHLLFIDNASHDDSLGHAVNLVSNSLSLRDTKLETIYNSRDIGYGGSISKAFQYGIKQNYEWMIIVHSDDQTDWKVTINTIKMHLLKDRTDIILGSRFLSKDLTEEYSALRKFGNRFFIFATYFFTGARLSDPGAAIGGYRLEKCKDIDFAKLNQSYHFHPELNLIFAARKFRLEIFALKWKDATSSDGLRVWIYGMKLLQFLVKLWFLRFFKRKDLESAIYEL